MEGWGQATDDPEPREEKTPPSSDGESTRRARFTPSLPIGGDRSRDTVLVLALFAVYAILDRWIDALVEIQRDDLNRASLLAGSVGNRWWLYLITTAVLAAATAQAGRRVWCSWDALDHGWLIRRLVGAATVVLVWQDAFYDYNYLADRLHLADRVLVVLLGLAAVMRPVAVVPFVVQVRIIHDQFLQPFGTTAGRNIDELLVLVLLAAAATHVLYVAARRRDTSPVVLLITAGVAAHFFVPGWAKFRTGWLEFEEIANLPIAAHTAGWMGRTDGWWADGLSMVYRRFGPAVLIAVLVLELAAPLAVLRPRFARWWLPLIVVFHLFAFATIGYWFLAWLTVEIGLAVIYWRVDLELWATRNTTPTRSLIGLAAATLGATVLFHPPGLAWFDAPVSYGYRVEAIGVSGQAYNVPLAAFAPLDQEMAFLRPQLGPTLPASGAYGAVTSSERLAQLEAISDFDQLANLEATLGPPTLTAESVEFVQAFADYAGTEGAGPFFFSAPSHYWTSAPAPSYHFDEPIAQLDVFLVAVINNEESDLRQQRVTPVLTVVPNTAPDPLPDG